MQYGKSERFVIFQVFYGIQYYANDVNKTFVINFQFSFVSTKKTSALCIFQQQKIIIG